MHHNGTPSRMTSANPKVLANMTPNPIIDSSRGLTRSLMRPTKGDRPPENNAMGTMYRPACWALRWWPFCRNSMTGMKVPPMANPMVVMDMVPKVKFFCSNKNYIFHI